MEVSHIPSLLLCLSPVKYLAPVVFLSAVNISVALYSYNFIFRNEIGATNPATSKWVVEGGHVYKKTKNAKEGGPMTPTEGIYKLMTQIHQAYGHKGRDGFFSLVKLRSGSIKKAFCHQFVQVCCKRAESWQASGSVPYGWQAPVKQRRAGRNNAADDDKEVDDNAIIGNMNATAKTQRTLININAPANVQRPPTPPITPDADGQFVSPFP
jgi:hypothetical protein